MDLLEEIGMHFCKRSTWLTEMQEISPRLTPDVPIGKLGQIPMSNQLIKIKNTTFPHAITVRMQSEPGKSTINVISYSLVARPSLTFRCAVGIQDEGRLQYRKPVCFYVVGDDTVLWDSGQVWDQIVRCNVNVVGIHTLHLVVESWCPFQVDTVWIEPYLSFITLTNTPEWTPSVSTTQNVTRSDASNKKDASPSVGEDLYKFVSKLFGTSLLSDFTVVVERTSIPAHRLVLGARSSYFRALFESGMNDAQQNQITMSDVSLSNCMSLLEWMYTGNIRHSEEEVLELFILADRYGCEELKSNCEQFLITGVNTENAAVLFWIAEAYASPLLITQCLHYLIMHWEDIQGTEEYQQLDADLKQSIASFTIPDDFEFWDAVLFNIQAQCNPSTAQVGRKVTFAKSEIDSRLIIVSKSVN